MTTTEFLETLVNPNVAWRPEDALIHPPPSLARSLGVYRPDILDVIQDTIEGLSAELRKLSLDISGMLSQYCDFIY